jgi:2,3-bisphosphoglycerate-dependent phosphoglycerate mutase
MAKLVLVRHGISKWNKLGQWTGWTDVPLATEGFEEAKKTARAIKDVSFDVAFVSDLVSAQQTLETIKKTLGTEIPTTIAPEIKERDYGDLTGKNKWQVKEEYGEEQFNKWRRGWDDPVPNGENLKMVYERAVPYYIQHILPELILGKNVLVSSHGNTIRALAKYLDKVADSDTAKLEINTGEAFVYEIDKTGEVISKEVRATNERKV